MPRKHNPSKIPRAHVDEKVGSFGQAGDGDSVRRVASARVFRNGRNQAIRIPVDMSFDTDTVLLEKRGDVLLVRPRRQAGWDRFFADPDLVLPEDFDFGEDTPPPDREIF